MIEGIDYCFIYPKDDNQAVHIKLLNGTYKDTPFPWTQDVLLGSSLWGSLGGGGATCTAKLESFPAVVKPGQNKVTNLGTFTYYVSP